MKVVKSAPLLLSRALSTFDSLPSSPSYRYSILNGHNSIDKHDADPETLVSNNILVQLQQPGSCHDPFILNKIISFCSKSHLFDVGIQLHSKAIKLGFTSNVYICSALVGFYGKCGQVGIAHQLFDEMPQRNVVTWNSLMSGYLEAGFPEVSVGLFMGMLREGIMPSAFGVSAALMGCAQLEAGKLGAQVHGLCSKCGVCSNVVVATGFVDMYAKCWNLDDSRHVFELMHEKNDVTWTTMIASCVYNELPYDAMILFREMQRLDLRSNCVTCNSLLSSFSGREHLDHCKQIHCHVIREGLESDVYIQISLVTVYSECKCSPEDLDEVCLNITKWDRISWNALIAGFSHLGCGEKALQSFSKMQRSGIASDSVTLTSVLRAIGIISALEVGKQVHALAFKIGSESSLHVQNGLVSMYGRCASIDDSRRVFLTMKGHDLVSWNSLLAGFSHQGNGQEVIELFEEMRKTNIQPDKNTFISVLSACSHAGLVEKGLSYFNLLKKLHPDEPLTVELYASIVDILGRAGYIHEAETFIDNLPMKPGPSVYKSLLNACKVHGNIEVGSRVANKLLELYPNDSAAYVLLSNSLATQDCWDEAEGVWKLMQHRRLEKGPGYSSVG